MPRQGMGHRIDLNGASRGMIVKIGQAILAALILSAPSSVFGAVNILQDGTFQNSTGTGFNLTPWSSWTGTTVTRYAAPAGIPGNVASLSWGTDLFQRFTAPVPGIYTLSFYVQNPMPYATKMIVDIQQPFGGGWHLMDQVISLDASTDFVFQSYTVNWSRAQRGPSEFYFSNSYDYPDPARGFEGTVNPPGTFLNVADARLTALQLPTVPEPASWRMMIIGFAAIGFAMRQQTAGYVSHHS